MIVLLSTYLKVKMERDISRQVSDSLVERVVQLERQNEELAKRNKKIDADYMALLFAKNGSSQFSEADLKILISLCHPDKHGGSPVANAITAKLIKMRNK